MGCCESLNSTSEPNKCKKYMPMIIKAKTEDL